MARKPTHGCSGGKGHRTREYEIWSSIIQRCHNPKNPGYKSYGARGITVCKRWRHFPHFRDEMGLRPSNRHTIERRENDKGYWCGQPSCPECGPLERKANCRWATQKEQMHNMRRNRLIEYNGETHCLAEWAEILGVNVNLLHQRLRRGWSEERAIATPAEQPVILEYNGESHSISEWAKIRGTNKQTISERLSRGWSVERTLAEPIRKYARSDVK